jgi:MFS family permease
MTRRAYAIIITCFFTVSLAYGIRYAYGMLLPEMLPDLGISKTKAGTIFAVYFLVYSVSTPVLGTLSDLFNYRLLVPLFTVVLATGALLMAYADGFLKACLIFSIAGLGNAACWAPVAALVSKWVPDHKRGTALSFVTMGVGMGILLWSTLIPMIVSAADWRAGWLSLGLFGFGVAALNIALVRNPVELDRPKFSLQEHARQVWITYKSLFGNKTFWMVGTAYLLIGFNVLVPFTFLPVYARESLHLAYATSTRLIAVIAFFGIIGQLTLGPLSDRVGRVHVLILCGLIMGAGCLGMIFPRTVWGLYVFTAVYGLGYGPIWPVYAALASDFFPKSNTGSVVGLWTVFLGIGSMASPVVCGWTIDKTASYSFAFGLGLCSGILSALILISLVCVPGPIRRTRVTP